MSSRWAVPGLAAALGLASPAAGEEQPPAPAPAPDPSEKDRALLENLDLLLDWDLLRDWNPGDDPLLPAEGEPDRPEREASR